MAYKSLIHVFVVDDHAIIREGLTAMFSEQKDIRVVGEAGDGHEALEQIAKKKPHVVLLDVRMPNLDGFETLERLRAKYPKVSVIMLSATAMPNEMARARKLGAHGMISKDAECAEICSIISKVHHGAAHWPRTRAGRTTLRPNLSTREIQVLQSARSGLSEATIARTLKITEHAVKSHLKNLLKKLGVFDVPGAVARL
jgi:two-component system, NarL family, response regulator